MRVLIAGGGNVGAFVAEELAESGHEVVILEIDPARVAHMSDRMQTPGVEWVLADACEIDELAAASPQTAHAMLAVTGDDEDNLVVSLLAKQEFGVPRVVARVNNPKNERLFDETWGVDVSVSTPHLLAALAEEAVTVGRLVRILSLERGRARLVEVTLADDSPAVGLKLSALEIPRTATVVAVVREGGVAVPRGDTEILAGDEVLLLTVDSDDTQLQRVFIGE